MKKLIFILLLIAFLVLMAVEFDSAIYTILQCCVMVSILVLMFKIQTNEKI